MYRVIFSAFLACATSFATIPECPTTVAKAASPMDYVEICKGTSDCKKFSRLVMGTDHLVQANWTREGQPELTHDEAFRVLDEAAKLGINFFDTSPIYVGGVENILGKWKKSRAPQIVGDAFYADPRLNPDRKLYALSKGGFPFDVFWAKRLEAGTHSAELRAELEKFKDIPPGTYASRLFGPQAQITQRVAEELGHSTRNLDGDITIYLMHRDDGDAVAFKAITRPQTSVKTIMQAIGAPEVGGKVWMVGWSNWQPDRISESIQLAAEKGGLPKPVITSPYFSLFEMSERSIHALGVQVTHKEMMDPSFLKGIRIMPYSPLGGFSILDKPDPKWESAKKAAKEKFDKGDPYWQNVYHSIFTDANEARWNRVVEFTKAFNLRNRTEYTVDQMMTAYVLAHPRTDLLAIGAITVEQVRRSVAALELSKRLTAADLEFLYSGK